MRKLYFSYILNPQRVFVNSTGNTRDLWTSAGLLGGGKGVLKVDYMYQGSTASELAEIHPGLECGSLGWIGGKGERYAWIDLSGSTFVQLSSLLHLNFAFSGSSLVGAIFFGRWRCAVIYFTFSSTHFLAIALGFV